MAVKFVIYNGFGGECEYVRAVCKVIDPTLTDSDFDLVYSGRPGYVNDEVGSAVDYYRQTYASATPKPILIRPTALANNDAARNIGPVYNYYPDVPMVTSFYKNGVYPNRPVPFTLDPDRLTPAVLVNGGVAGISDWFTGNALDYVEPASVMYISGATNITSFPIANVQNMGGGVARITSQALEFFSTLHGIAHITGVGGFANNINGKRAIVVKYRDIGTPANSYVEVNFELGAGTFSGTATAQIQYSSGAIAAVAAKLGSIMRQRNCSFWEARYCANVTGSQAGVRTNQTGYGSIDVAAAVAFDASIPADPYDTLGAVGTLSLSVVDGVATFTHPEVLNARGAFLYANDEILFDFAVANPYVIFYGRSLSFIHRPIKLGNIAYKLKAVRDGQVSVYTNQVSTNILELTGQPPEPIYPVGFDAYYWNGFDINHSAIVSVLQTVTNPENDNEGVVLTEYLLADGATVVEAKLYASHFDALAGQRVGEYINSFAPVTFDTYSSKEDLCGQDFRYTDFTDGGDYDFTDAIVANSNFDNATLPAIYSGDEGLELFLSTVAFCNKRNTIWVNGLSVEEELEA